MESLLPSLLSECLGRSNKGLLFGCGHKDSGIGQVGRMRGGLSYGNASRWEGSYGFWLRPRGS